MTARSIGGSRRRRCVCGLACPGRSPFLWQAGSPAPSPTHAACGHTGESAEHDARHRRLLGRLDSAGAQLVGTSLPRGREPESQGPRLAEREPETQLGCASRPRPARGATRARAPPPHEPACTADSPCAPTLSGGDMGVVRGGHVLAAQVRLAAPRGHRPRAERRQHHRLRAMQIRRACPRAHLPRRRAALRPPPRRRPAAPTPIHACRPPCVPQMRGRRSPVR
jgi:hypothetical protein